MPTGHFTHIPIISKSVIHKRGNLPEKHPLYAFHILRTIREYYGVEEDLFQLNGNVIFANFYQARSLAAKMNEKRDTLRFPETAITAGHINAMGLIDEILHYVIGLYKEQENGTVFSEALAYLETSFSPEEIDSLLRKFTELYPPLEVYKGAISPADYLKQRVGDISNREIVLEEMLLLQLANNNPACNPFIELFDHTELEETTVYSSAMKELSSFFESQPKFGPKGEALPDMLHHPAKVRPNSLSGQIQFMLDEWGILLGKYLLRLLQSIDFIKEEERPFFTGPGPAEVYTYDREKEGGEEEIEQFSKDKEWMPKVVLLAKSTYVWLHQLSEKYNRKINKLDQIPDEEIERICSYGFTGLWLIGLWERSPASKRIKQICGNPEAEASAYSLLEYEIAADLGGWEALHHLKNQCMRRGIRLASDMVPNHTGIDSKWVVNHPDWFVQLPYQPYPQYSYNGTNLGPDDRVGIYIDDHYYDKTDAAVTFKRVDHYTGDERFIYHGNDGTSMPWNDTAQLNFLNPEVREAVIQTILHVARNFSVIRFDAAMTLTKKHFQRLWFPEPGKGGDIPTRAEHGLSRDDFNRAMPVEFWREVVDRIHDEVPDTLLLAEAFWLMEGYFVRTLGMHRVYNSAFMNMLKKEENKKYRSTIKNTQEFDPNILKRFVNFMNNPDEDTAVEQFGDDDKYFGVCTMLITMPGLPMFGHGQIEGFREKYGMEYRRSYWDEGENTGLIQRHEKEIFPLIKKRYLFAEVENFLLYDVYTAGGGVNENIFAYSNMAGEEKALVLYNNSYDPGDGWINMSAAYAEKQEDGSKRLVQKGIAQGLEIPADYRCFVIFQEQSGEIWYIRNCKEIWDRGLYIALNGYETNVFLNFYVVYDDEYGHYSQLVTALNGKGTKNIRRSLQEIFMEPVHSSFNEMMTKEVLKALDECVEEGKPLSEKIKTELKKGYVRFLEQAAVTAPAQFLTGTEKKNGTLLGKWIDAAECTVEMLREIDSSYLHPGATFIVLFLPFYLSLSTEGGNGEIAEELLLDKPVSEALNQLLKKGADETIREIISALKVTAILEKEISAFNFAKPDRFFTAVFKSAEVSRFLGENRYNNILYFNKEAFELFIRFLFPGVILMSCRNHMSEKETEKEIRQFIKLAADLEKEAKKAGYAAETFIKNLKRKKG